METRQQKDRSMKHSEPPVSSAKHPQAIPVTVVGVNVSSNTSDTPYHAMAESTTASPNNDPPAGSSSLAVQSTNDISTTTTATGPPPRSLEHSHNPYSILPPGWATAVDPHDGRIYYYERASGQTSWAHPSANQKNHHHPHHNTGGVPSALPLSPPPPSSSFLPSNNPGQLYPYNTTHADYDPRWARSRPDNHQCSAVTALVLFFPLGIFAIYHSYKTDASWKAGKYGDAVVHARQAKQYASWGTTLGILFWILWFFFRRGKGEWEWPNVGEWFRGGG